MVLGPTLWNVVFGDLIRLTLLKEVELVAYADDLAVFVSVLLVPDMEAAARDAIEAFQV